LDEKSLGTVHTKSNGKATGTDCENVKMIGMELGAGLSVKGFGDGACIFALNGRMGMVIVILDFSDK